MGNPEPGKESSPEAEALLANVKVQGELIANMKKQGIVEKAKLEPHVAKLKALKAEYKELTGIDLDAKAKADAKKEKDASNGAGTTVNEKNAAKNAAKKAEKLAKFEAKKKAEEEAKAAKAAAGAEKPAKEKKAKKEKEEIVFVNKTPKGEFKDLSQSDFDSYQPAAVESAWYDWWEKQGYFKPEGPDGKVHDNPKGIFMMAIPPPNVTGSLHLGHALTNAIEDTLTRWNRMRGLTTLWNPGCDHAGIATQVVVEKMLMKEQGITRHEIGREKFVEKVWEWKEDYGGKIYNQIRGLGASVDWDRAAFTMDPKMVRAVTEAFVRMYDNGKIYRSSRLVNWSPALKSAISDLEVDHKELEGRTMMTVVGHGDKLYEFGTLTHFVYPIEDSDEMIEVATTRIETMLGDVAVAVHPEDPKYKHLHGKFAVHPFTHRRMPIVCDEYVDMNFGTGAVKITPGHDFNDYELGLRHNLPIVSILNDDGTINDVCEQFAGMKRFDARDAVLAALKELGYYRSTTDNAMTLPICSRSKDIVEPIVKPQWFADMTEPARRSVEAVRNGELRLIPDSHEKTWYRWLENIKPWCISRQLWWGHRIPAYFVDIEGEAKRDESDDNYWVVGRDENEARERAAKKFGVEPSRITLHQDPDVLDTWFSSGLFPFSIFGWPEETDDFKRFFPGTLLETGHDILFFWVARMVMMSLELCDTLPFKDVYLHAIIRDAHGRKMSKSLGNVIDPLDVIHGVTLDQLIEKLYQGNLDPREIEKALEGQKADYPNGIPECGTDALRFALVSYTMAGKDVNLDVKRIESYRHFCNKLWNALRFARARLGPDFVPLAQEQKANDTYSLMDRWILSRLSQCVKAVNEGMRTYTFPTVTTAIYSFWLYDFCDVYLEYTKPVFASGTPTAQANAREVLYTCLDVGLRLLHPIMPFLTEELYQRLPRRAGEHSPSIMVAPYPEEALHIDEAVEAEEAMAFEITKAIRSVRARYLQPKDKPEVVINCKSADVKAVAQKYLDLITTLANIGSVSVVVDEKPAKEKGCAMDTVGALCEVYVVVKGLVDASKELQKAEKQLAQLLNSHEKLVKQTQIPDYESKVPEEVRAANAEKLASLAGEIESVKHAIEMYQSLM